MTENMAVNVKERLGWKFFMGLLNDDPNVDASEEEMLNFVKEELKFDWTKYPAELVESLPVILVAYMNMWSGWQFKREFNQGKFSMNHYFTRFLKFLAYKLNMVIRTGFSNASKAMESERKTLIKSSGINESDKFSPVAISIKCPPSMVNTVVFASQGDDVILKQHLGSIWQPLSTVQLINWPYINVTFQSPTLYFTRKQVSDYARYLNFLPHECEEATRPIICSVESQSSTRQCYSTKYFLEYITAYVRALKSRNVEAQKVEEVQMVLTQFYEDIKHVDINESFVTDTRVVFKLVVAPFIRNKRLVKGNGGGDESTRVGYCELIIPKVELFLKYFKGDDIKLPGNNLQSPRAQKFKIEALKQIPAITYSCTFCGDEYGGYDSKRKITTHLHTEHKMEQNVRCTTCKEQFDMLNLTACRFKHQCVVEPVSKILKKSVKSSDKPSVTTKS